LFGLLGGQLFRAGGQTPWPQTNTADFIRLPMVLSYSNLTFNSEGLQRLLSVLLPNVFVYITLVICKDVRPWPWALARNLSLVM